MLKMVIILALLSGSAKADTEVKYVTDPWPPHTMGRVGEIPVGGLVTAVIRDVFKRVDESTYLGGEITPWSEALRRMKTGEADVSGPMLMNDERKSYILYVYPHLFKEKSAVFYDQTVYPDFNWSTLRDLEPFVVGVMKGSDIGGPLLIAIEEDRLKARKYPTTRQNLIALVRGEVDIMIGNSTVVGYLISRNQNYRWRIVESPKATNYRSYYIGISKKSPWAKRIGEISDVVHQMKSEGIIDTMMGIE